MDEPRTRVFWIRTIGYWVLTLIVAWEMLAGSMWDLLQIEVVRSVFAELHYPLYLLYIIGVWKLPCALALLAPRFGRLKEWAYAGAFFNYTGAAASHVLSGQGASHWVGPVVFAAVTLGSWALRPPSRRLAAAAPTTKTRLIHWIVPLAVAAAMLLVSLMTLPKGPAPG